jgi:asparagine synthase (glutamine-hydrolysing)
MCGIAGFIGEGEALDAERMISAIRYRGPDDTGVETFAGGVFAHARLSFVDLSAAGHQPMLSAHQRALIVFNGEIYNFEALRDKCTGYPFKGRSDTEVILALYERYGEKCFSMLDGMFAIALWDMQTRTLYLARDRMGKKPLYWGIFEGTLLFASEPKAIFEHPIARKHRALDRVALAHYLALDYVPTPLSIYEGLHKVPPASCVVYDGKSTKEVLLWQPPRADVQISKEEALARLDKELKNATERRLIADVPIGVFLSGGLDSSVVAYYAQQSLAHAVHTFSIGFDADDFNEAPYAAQVAKVLGTIHHHRLCTSSEALALTPALYEKLDEPIADASLIPTTLLSQFTREHVKAALGGDGADELFAGYNTFQAEQIRRYLPMSLTPSLIRQAGALLFGVIPARYGHFSIDFITQKFLEGAYEGDLFVRNAYWLGSFSPHEQKALTHDMPDIDPYAIIRVYAHERPDADLHNQNLWMYARSYMMDQVLVKVDRAGMYSSLEVRAPFLDSSLVSFASSLPYEYKIKGLRTKYILKELMRGKLPDTIIDRKKRGFGIPIGRWLRGPLKAWAEDLISESALAHSDVFSPKAVQALWREHQEGVRDHRKKLWNILVFQSWSRKWYTA